MVGGDILPGPMPRETISRLRELDIPANFILGNCEVALLDQTAGRVPAGVPEAHRSKFQWTAAQLVSDDVGWLARWPKTLRLRIPGLGDVLFCHATPRNENECFTRLTPEERLSPVFEAVHAAVVVCGHTHMQFDRTVGKVRVVNAGSVGMPFGEPGAYWALLGPDVELRRTRYDLDAAAERIRSSGYPEAKEFAASSVLHPPSEQAMLAAFARAELK